MSQENVESVLTMWAASMEGDPAELDLSLLAEDIVYEDDILPDHGSETYHGQTGSGGPGLAPSSRLRIPKTSSNGLGTRGSRWFPATAFGAVVRRARSRSRAAPAVQQVHERLLTHDSVG